jgi:hypothetical protein
MSRTFGFTTYFRCNGFAHHEEQHHSIKQLLSSMVREDLAPARYFSFSEQNSLLIEEAIQRTQQTITIEQVFIQARERLVINLIDNTILRYPAMRMNYSISALLDIICIMVEQVDGQWTSLQNPEWPFHVTIYNRNQHNNQHVAMNSFYTIHHVRIENNRVFCAEGISD